MTEPVRGKGEANKLYELIVLSGETMYSVLVIQATGKNARPFLCHIFDGILEHELIDGLIHRPMCAAVVG
jgi:hypothetical protein